MLEVSPLKRIPVLRPLREFIQTEAKSGVILMGAAIAALILANSSIAERFFAFWQTPVPLGIATKPLLLWINDGLMAVFFFVVGLEIKREILTGELASPRKAALPFFAALGGMVVPAGIYAIANAGTPGIHGWGIPMATDIAFALGALSLLGRRAPLALKIFLTAVAIVDDIGAVLVIAIFYSSDINLTYLGGGLAIVAGLFLLNRLGVRNLAFYIVPGLVLWVLFLKSGVHATVAGVLLAFTIPAGDPLERAEHALQPFVSYLIMPLFALANAGVAVSRESFASLADPVGIGVLTGLWLGKPLGIIGAAWVAVKCRFATLPARVNWWQMTGVGVLAGIGFTMSLFINDLAFTDPGHLATAKIAILCASAMAGVLGYLVLRAAASETQAEPPDA